MKIAYRKTGWRATDVRFVDDNYVPADGETVMENDVLPAAESLSDHEPEQERARKEIVGLESINPITHRALREFFIGFGDQFPQFKETHLYQECKRVDDLIRVERAKL
jgi:hypothetical protein